MSKQKLTIKYISLWDSATPEQKEEYQRNIDHVYDMIFKEAMEEIHKKQKKNVLPR